jgi:anti-sigma factor RsiW
MITCLDIKKFTSPYLDSELDATTIFHIQHHLAECAACRERVEREMRLEANIRVVLTASRVGDDEMWRRALTRAIPSAGAVAVAPSIGPDRAMRRPFFARNWKRMCSLLAAALIATIGIAFIHVHVHPEMDENQLASIMVSNHSGLTGNHIQPAIRTGSHQAVQDYFSRRHIAIPSPVVDDQDLELVGASECAVGGQAVPCIMYRYQGAPISLYALENKAGMQGQAVPVVDMSQHNVGAFRFSTIHHPSWNVYIVNQSDDAAVDHLIRSYDLVQADPDDIDY